MLILKCVVESSPAHKKSASLIEYSSPLLVIGVPHVAGSGSLLMSKPLLSKPSHEVNINNIK